MFRRFTHLITPADVWFHTGISKLAANLWAEIYALHCHERGGCYASEEYLCAFMGIQRRQLYVYFKQLKDAGLLKTVVCPGKQTIRIAIPPKEYQSEATKKNLEIEKQNHKKDILKKNQKKEENGSESAQSNTLKVHNQTQLPLYIEESLDRKERESGLTADALALFLFDQLKKIHPKFKTPNFNLWKSQILNMIHKDGRTLEEIQKALIWIFNAKDKFWTTRILSPEKLAKCFDTISIQMIENKMSKNEIKAMEEKKVAEMIQNNRKVVNEFVIKYKKYADLVRIYNDRVEIKTKTGFTPIGYTDIKFGEIINLLIKEAVVNEKK